MTSEWHRRTAAACAAPPLHQGSPALTDAKIGLRPHQQVLARAMVDFAKEPFHLHTQPKLFSRYGHLNAKIGTGKTLVVAAVLRALKIPPAYEFHLVVAGGVHCVVHHEKFCPCAVIFVSNRVVPHWKAELERAGLRPLVVDSVKTLKSFSELFFSHEVNTYDAVVVKSGTVTAAYEVGGCYGFPSLPAAFVATVNSRGPVLFPHQVFDDFDRSRFDCNMTGVDATINWLVSSTNERPAFKSGLAPRRRDARARSSVFLRPPGFGLPMLSQLSKSETLKNYFRFYCESDFVSRSVNLPRSVLFEHRVRDQFRAVRGALTHLFQEDADALTEMMNGGCTEALAKQLNVTASTPTELLMRLLNQTYVKYWNAVRILDNIQRIRRQAAELSAATKNVDSAIAQLRCDVAACRPFGYQSWCAALAACLEALEHQHALARDKCAFEVSKVRDALTIDACPVCDASFADDEVQILIMHCCYSMVCSDCVLLNPDRQSVRTGRCVACNREVDFKASTTYISRIENLKHAVASAEEIVKNTPAEALGAAAGSAPGADAPDPKTEKVLAIIAGETAGSQRKEIREPSLVTGARDAPSPAPQGDKRFLLVVNHHTSLARYKLLLDGAGVSNGTLRGNHRDVARTLERFRRRAFRVLIVHADNSNAGMNLQCLVDEVIFTLRIANRSLFAQILGRCMRMGRAHNVVAHNVFYEDE